LLIVRSISFTAKKIDTSLGLYKPYGQEGGKPIAALVITTKVDEIFNLFQASVKFFSIPLSANNSQVDSSFIPTNDGEKRGAQINQKQREKSSAPNSIIWLLNSSNTRDKVR